MKWIGWPLLCTIVHLFLQVTLSYLIASREKGAMGAESYVWAQPHGLLSPCPDWLRPFLSASLSAQRHRQQHWVPNIEPFIGIICHQPGDRLIILDNFHYGRISVYKYTDTRTDIYIYIQFKYIYVFKAKVLMASFAIAKQQPPQVGMLLSPRSYYLL